MSKSKGNVLDPLDLIDGINIGDLVDKRTSGMMNPQDAQKIAKRTRKQFPEGIESYGTDALRVTFCALASTSRDINFDLGRVEGYRNYCNKLWNAARYVLMNTEGEDCGKDNTDFELSIADQWIISKLQNAIKDFEKHIKDYRFDLATQTLYEFSRSDYCDWYLELSKPILYSDEYSAAQKRGTRHTLVNVLETMMRLLHPMMPFITEEIWQKLKPMVKVSSDTIMLASFPQFDESRWSEKSLADLAWLQKVIVAVRNIRGELNVSPGKPVNVLLKGADDNDRRCLGEYRGFLSALAKLESINEAGDTTPPASTAIAGNMEILVPLAGLIDVSSEVARLNKEIEKLESDKSRLAGKLSNANFVERAPAEVVAKEKEKLSAAESAISKLIEQRSQLESL